MTEYTYQVAMIAPAKLWPQVGALLGALGWKLGNGVQLSPTGDEPATHLGVYTPLTTEQLAIATGQVTPEIEGVDPDTIKASVSQLTVTYGDRDTDQWTPALKNTGVQPVTSDEV